MPAYNEGQTIGGVLSELKDFLQKNLATFEIIVINDGSTDTTADILKQVEGVTVIQHIVNKGYGASLQDGIRRARFNHVLFFDGDGQFPPTEISKLLPYASDFEMVVGERNSSASPIIRRPGKWFLHLLANSLSNRPSPDLNSGLRIIRRDHILPFWHLLPGGFSITTTSTLLFQQSDLSIKYVPVVIRPRAGGKSSVSASQAFRMFLLILRTIILFAPLRVFLPTAFIIFLIGALSFLNDLLSVHITNTTVLLFMSSLLIFLMRL